MDRWQVIKSQTANNWLFKKSTEYALLILYCEL